VNKLQVDFINDNENRVLRSISGQNARQIRRIIFLTISTIYAPEPLIWRASRRASAVKEGCAGVGADGSGAALGGVS
jgi:hypothetical protein